jgi:hypothetical protein
VKKESIGFSIAKDIDHGKNNKNFKTKFQYCLVYLFLVGILFLVFFCVRMYLKENWRNGRLFLKIGDVCRVFL